MVHADVWYAGLLEIQGVLGRQADNIVGSEFLQNVLFSKEYGSLRWLRRQKATDPSRLSDLYSN